MPLTINEIGIRLQVRDRTSVGDAGPQGGSATKGMGSHTADAGELDRAREDLVATCVRLVLRALKEQRGR
jgi:hypothetical protein